jgi:pyrimidine-specific ribonucleoside hydrolase
MAPIILDCDPGHDDALALMLALASPEVDLLGVTTVAGNQTLQLTTANALNVLDFLEHGEVPVVAGASRPLVRELRVANDVHGESGLEGAELPTASVKPRAAHAVDWIAETVLSSVEPVTVVATGPLTNLGLLLARYPEVERHVAEIVMMGGAIGEGNVTPAAEFNVWADPEAAHRVISSKMRVTMVNLDVTHRALITQADLDALATAGRAGRLVADLYSFYLPYHVRRYGWRGAPAHDAMAMAHVIDGGVLATQHLGVIVDTGAEPARGRTYVDRWGRAGWEPNAHVATEVDSDRFLSLLLERIASLG